MQILISGAEQERLRKAIIMTNDLKGDIAEVGVFEGGSAYLMLESTNKPVHLFDTFSGLPDSEGVFIKGQYCCTLLEVQHNLSKFPNAVFHKGVFPETAIEVADKKFSVVHIDCDLSKTVKDALNFFGDRLAVGGYIFIHDQHEKKIREVIAEYIQDHKIPV